MPFNIGDTVLSKKNKYKGVLNFEEDKVDDFTFLMHSKEFGDYNIFQMGKCENYKDNIDWLYVASIDIVHCKMLLIEKKWINYDWIMNDYKRYYGRI